MAPTNLAASSMPPTSKPCGVVGVDVEAGTKVLIMVADVDRTTDLPVVMTPSTGVRTTGTELRTGMTEEVEDIAATTTRTSSSSSLRVITTINSSSMEDTTTHRRPDSLKIMLMVRIAAGPLVLEEERSTIILMETMDIKYSNDMRNQRPNREDMVITVFMARHQPPHCRWLTVYHRLPHMADTAGMENSPGGLGQNGRWRM
jgi:hypothetical protein